MSLIQVKGHHRIIQINIIKVISICRLIQVLSTTVPQNTPPTPPPQPSLNPEPQNKCPQECTDQACQGREKLCQDRKLEKQGKSEGSLRKDQLHNLELKQRWSMKGR